MDEQEFYDRVAGLLGTTHEFRERTPVRQTPLRDGVTYKNTYKSRYNGREPGNGRFPGHGIIRDFGATIFVNFTDPKVSGSFKTYDEALDAIVAAEVAKNDAAVTDNPVGYRIMTDGEIGEVRARTKAAHAAVKATLEKRKMVPATKFLADAIDEEVPTWEGQQASMLRARALGMSDEAIEKAFGVVFPDGFKSKE